jgi:hypothetical protein
VLRTAISLGFVAVLVLGFVPGCDDENSGNPGDSGDWGYQCIPPEGATYEIDRPGDSADGVRVAVQPGDWEGCWHLEVSPFFHIFFPDGFETYDPPDNTDPLPVSFLIRQYGQVPDTIELELSLPAAGMLPPGLMQLPAAFWEDETADTWRIVLVDAVEGDRLIVRTSKPTNEYEEQWSWGYIQLDEADYAESLAPLMAELYGDSEWAEIQLELQQLYDAYVKGRPLSCNTLSILEDLFTDVKSNIEVQLVNYQQGAGAACGACDVRTWAFVDEFVEYVELRALDWFWTQFLLNADGWAVLFPAIKLGQVWDALDSLSCNYRCFFENGYPGLGGDLASYWVSGAIVKLADWSQDEYSCP